MDISTTTKTSQMSTLKMTAASFSETLQSTYKITRATTLRTITRKYIVMKL